MNRKNSKKKGAPELNAAVICERVIEDKNDKTITIIRLLDTYTLNLPPDTPLNVPSEEYRIPISFSIALAIKTGDSVGEQNVQIVGAFPSGKKQKIYDRMVTLSKEPYGGANLVLNQTIALSKGGLFWFEVFLNGKRKTRIPLLVNITRQQPLEELPKKKNGDKK